MKPLGGPETGISHCFLHKTTFDIILGGEHFNGHLFRFEFQTCLNSKLDALFHVDCIISTAVA